MEKKNMVKRVILIIISILIVLFIIHVTRNYIIINKITNAYEDFVSADNKYYEEEMPSSEPDLISHHEYYYRNGKSRFSMELRDETGKTVDGMYKWCDEEAKECIFTTFKTKNASIDDYGYENVSDDYLILKFTQNTFVSKLKNAIFSIISYDEVEGEKCYKINRALAPTSNVYYFRTSDGMLAKIYMPGKTMNEKGEVISEGSFVVTKNFKINSLTEEDVARPDLTGYNVSEHKRIPLDEYETYDDEDE